MGGGGGGVEGVVWSSITFYNSAESPTIHFNPLYTDEPFYCYMLDEPIGNFRGVRSILSLLFNF